MHDALLETPACFTSRGPHAGHRNSPTTPSHSGIWNMTLMALVWSAVRAHSNPSSMPWAVKGNLWLIMGARSIWPVVIISMQSGYCTHQHPVNVGGQGEI